MKGWRPRSSGLALTSLGLLGAFWLCAPSAKGQTTAPTPEPSPTEASLPADKRITVVGSARSPIGTGDSESANQAARLNAYRQLMQQGAELLGTLPADGNARTGFQFLRVNSEHPQDALLSWVLRSSFGETKDASGKEVHLSLTSPPLTEIHNESPQFINTVNLDVDSDGRPVMVAAGYDGRIHVFRAPTPAQAAQGSAAPGKLEPLGTSSCLASYTHVTYTVPGGSQPSWEQVFLTRLVSLRSAERAGTGKVRVVAELTSSEEVAGQFLGRATEEREVLVHLDNPDNEPTLELERPADFSQTAESSVTLKGVFRAPEGLDSARLRYNGRPFWQSPEGLNSRKLRMNVVVPLLPGWNSAQVQLVDRDHRFLSREVLIRREAPPPALQPGKRRAVLIGVGNYDSPNFERLPNAEADVEAVKRFIMGPQNGAGFALQNVSSIKGQQATRTAILSALRQLRVEQSSPTNQERTFTLIYFAGLSVKSASLGGKALLPYDAKGVDVGALSPKDLLEALGPLGSQDVLLILDTAQSQLSGRPPGWLDSQDFCAQLEQHGWAVLASGDLGPGERGAGDGGRFTKLLLSSLAGPADSDNDGLVEFDELYRNLFDLWMSQGPARQAPMRRGNLLGRTPVVAIKR